MTELYDHVVGAYPRIKERDLERRVLAVLSAAYGVPFDRDLEVLGGMSTEAATDALEVLQAAAELSSTIVGFTTVERPSGIRAAVSSVKPPPREK